MSLRSPAVWLIAASLACAPAAAQAPAPLELTAPFTPAVAQAPVPEGAKQGKASPERWALMHALQGSWPAALLEDNRMLVYGWTNVSFTASSDAHDNLPMGFNYRANEFLLQQ